MIVLSSSKAPSSAHAFVRQRTLRGLIRMRLMLAPAIGLIAMGVLSLDPAPWRIALVLPTITSIVVLSVVEARGSRDIGDRRFVANVVATALAQLIIVFASGGIASPIMPAVVFVAVLIAVFTPSRFALGFVGLVHVPAIWAFAFVQARGWVPGIVIPEFRGLFAEGGVGGPGPYFAASVYTMLVVAGSKVGAYFRRTIDELIEGYVVDQERALALHAEQARTLTALSAEIAHELKNPLASVKGLAALVRKDVDGTTAERVDVLRREVDRMQAILAEFLDYSRPLVPLQAEEIDLTQLAKDVMALHEGMARQRGVTLVVSSDAPFGHRADPRKLRAVLINLVQNAIEASPEGTSVEVQLERRSDGGLGLRVADRGTGLDPAIVEKLFTVGATTKAKGNGLGLAMARGLARQHGGELVLRPRVGGGTVAELALPRDLPSSEPLGAAA